MGFARPKIHETGNHEGQPAAPPGAKFITNIVSSPLEKWITGVDRFVVQASGLHSGPADR